MSRHPGRGLWVCVTALIVFCAPAMQATDVSFERGDIFVSLETGPVLWYHPDGQLNRALVGTVPGTGEGMGFDSSGNLYVARWCIDPWCSETGSTVEMFNVLGQSLGAVGSGYDCNPHAILFDPADTAYVGQAGCTGAVLKFPLGHDRDPTIFPVAPDNQGSFWIDLAPDGCTLFYTSYGPNVKRFDVCAGQQLADFNAAPLPGGATQDVRVLVDGSVLVSSGSVVARLSPAGVLQQTYSVAGEPAFWAGLDVTGGGAFWAVNYETSRVHEFDLATGAVLATVDTGMPSHTAVAVRIKK